MFASLLFIGDWSVGPVWRYSRWLLRRTDSTLLRWPDRFVRHSYPRHSLLLWQVLQPHRFQWLLSRLLERLLRNTAARTTDATTRYGMISFSILRSVQSTFGLHWFVLGCYHEGQQYPYGHTVRINCNKWWVLNDIYAWRRWLLWYVGIWISKAQQHGMDVISLTRLPLVPFKMNLIELNY